jgi:hypothetical protein
LLLIGGIIAGIAIAIVGITHAINAYKKNSLEGRMEAAAEATAEATQAAQDAKKAYDELLEEHDGYNETQKALKELTYGTQEWKNALIEAN